MDERHWDFFSPNSSLSQEISEDSIGASGSELLLQDAFEPDIVSKRFQEGGRLIFDHEEESPRFSQTSGDEFGYGQGVRGNSASGMGEVDSIMSIPAEDLLVKFDVLRHRVVQDGKKKFVLYTVIVMEVPKLDTDQAIIERRFSDFHNLHKGIRKDCPNAIKEAQFPKKELFGNYDSTLLETRGRMFEKYLRYIFHQQGVRQCHAFRDFFYVRHLKNAAACLCSEDYSECLEQYRLGLQLQRKLQDSNSEIVATLCGLVEVCKVQRRIIEAEKYAAQALEIMQYDIDNAYLLPLMKATIDLRCKLKIDFGWLHNKLRQIESRTGFDPDSPVTLRELAVKRY